AALPHAAPCAIAPARCERTRGDTAGLGAAERRPAAGRDHDRRHRRRHDRGTLGTAPARHAGDHGRDRGQAMSASAPTAAVPLIELRGVTKVYGSGTAAMHALRGVDLRIDAGEFVAIMGPSGSGKSTCMNILGCLDTPTSGTYLFQGVDVGRLDRNQRALLRRHYLGFVFQGFNLLNRTSALENVELPLLYRGENAAVRHERARRALAAVGLAGWEDHTPGELSG